MIERLDFSCPTIPEGENFRLNIQEREKTGHLNFTSRIFLLKPKHLLLLWKI